LPFPGCCRTCSRKGCGGGPDEHHGRGGGGGAGWQGGQAGGSRQQARCSQRTAAAHLLLLLLLLLRFCRCLLVAVLAAALGLRGSRGSTGTTGVRLRPGGLGGAGGSKRRGNVGDVWQRGPPRAGGGGPQCSRRPGAHAQHAPWAARPPRARRTPPRPRPRWRAAARLPQSASCPTRSWPCAPRSAPGSRLQGERGQGVGYAGLGCAGLGWAALGWAGLGWAGEGGEGGGGCCAALGTTGLLQLQGAQPWSVQPGRSLTRDQVDEVVVHVREARRLGQRLDLVCGAQPGLKGGREAGEGGAWPAAGLLEAGQSAASPAGAAPPFTPVLRTFFLQGPQLQQVTQPAPQEPRQAGQCHWPPASASATSSPCRLRRHILLRCGRGGARVEIGGGRRGAGLPRGSLLLEHVAPAGQRARVVRTRRPGACACRCRRCRWRTRRGPPASSGGTCGGRCDVGPRERGSIPRPPSCWCADRGPHSPVAGDAEGGVVDATALRHRDGPTTRHERVTVGEGMAPSCALGNVARGGGRHRVRPICEPS
jgi:hypothetical protein